MAGLDQARLKEVVIYSPETGVFTWNKSNCRGKAGNSIGYKCATHGYMRVMIDGKMYAQHRLAWLYMLGEWPKRVIDHVNGIRSDNRWSNLRDVSHSENQQNRRGRNSNRKHNLPRCVETCDSWLKTRAKPYRAKVRKAGKNYHLGYFRTVEEADLVARSYIAKNYAVGAE